MTLKHHVTSTKKRLISQIKSMDHWGILELILGLLLILSFTLTLIDSTKEIARFTVGILYIILVILNLLIDRDKNIPTFLILLIGAFLRLLLIYQGGMYSGSFAHPDVFDHHEWVGVLFKKSFDYAVSYYPLFEVGTVLIDVLISFLITVILKKRHIPKAYLILYLWNPFVIQYIYTHWNPYLLWTALLVSSGVLLIYQKRFLASILFACSIGFYDLSLLFIPLMVRPLRLYVLVPIGFYLGLLKLPSVLEFLTSRTLGSEFLQTFIHFLPGKESLSLDDYWILFIISITLSIIIWEASNKKDYLSKAYTSLLVIVLAYPPFFSETGLFLILLGTVYRNIGILVLSLYLYIQPQLISIAPSVFGSYDLYWQYGLVLSLNLIFLTNLVKKD